MNHPLASVLLPCVVSITIIIFLLFIQEIKSLEDTNQHFGSINNDQSHNRPTRSNQHDQNNNTNNNNRLQSYYPSKPNNLYSQVSNTNPNVSQTSSTPQSIIYSTSTQTTSYQYPANNPTSVTPTVSTTTFNPTQANGLNCFSNNPSCQTQQCHGRAMLNKTRGFITDGYGNYSVNTQCTWLIDSGNNNSLIRLRFSEFNTECNYDYLYIFDGDSIFSPLVAAFSGILKPIQTAFSKKNFDNLNSLISTTTSNSDIISNDSASISIVDDTDKRDLTFFDEIVVRSGKAFIYFHSDTAQSMPGFNLTYTINSCPYDCSGHGTCDTTKFECKCDPGYKGQGCHVEMCPNNCSLDTQSGRCDKLQGKCLCVDGYSGSDCSKKTDQGVWTKVENEQTADITSEGRSFHQALAIDDYIWIIGGKTNLLTNINSKDDWTNIISRYSLIDNKWVKDKLRAKVGQNDLAELVGHTAIYYDNKIFIYGGMLPNGTISNILIVFDTLSMTFESSNRYYSSDRGKKLDTAFEEDFVPPLGVIGHSSTVVGHMMYIFFGYNPLYGYLDLVQRYNIMDNTWTIVETKGSSVEGCIGHSSVYDENSKLILVYGGHHAHRSNSLYSYDPSQDTWRLLQPGPYPRYYHRSVTVNGLMIVLGGNSYNASSNQDACDDCFDSHTLMYDLDCIQGNHINHHLSTTRNDISVCDSNCWQVIDDPAPGVLQRYGHSVTKHRSSLFLYGGFNGLLLNTLYHYKIPDCLDYSNEKDCRRPKLALKCDWNQLKNSCHIANFMQKQSSSQAKDSSLIRSNSSLSVGALSSNQDYQCSIKLAQSICESRYTCRDCLYTNYGCRWCGNGQCKADKCKSIALESKAIVDPSLCYHEDSNSSSNSNFLSTFSPDTFTYKHDMFIQKEKELSADLECRRYVNCYLCQTKSYCSWQSDHHRQGCSFLQPRPLPTPTTLQSGPNTASLMTLSDPPYATNQSNQHSTASSTSSPINIWKHIFDSSPPFSNATLSMMDMLNAVTSYHSCESPCFRRKSCHECIQNKCIWCDTSNECIDSSAYFAYYPIGQCMHYVAHHSRCRGTSCSEIETCDQCQKNPKCGWVDDGTGRGTGQCLEGSSSGPLGGQNLTAPVFTGLVAPGSDLSKSHKWYFYNCPLCQCNGHSTCRPGTNICQKGCDGHTEGNHCEKCVAGYYGNPINGGICRECKCNGHASSCNKETGKCHCSTKGIIGHSCDKCDEQNHYLGDPTSPNDGTCYYNLTTDYQYTFNMSKADDYFYSDINFMNVPMKRDVDVDFTIVCSSLALVNITSGTPSLMYRYSTLLRRSLHTGLECGSFRLKFPYDEHIIGGGSNYTFYVHVYRFQTPFVLQIAFSQHRTLDLWQFFFTFASCFLFLFVMAGVVWKLKQKYDLYRRRQQHVIEMEQMASRPFATILLELTGGFGFKRASSVDLKLTKYANNSDQADNCRALIENIDTKGIPNHGDEELPRSSRSVSRISLDKFHDVDYHKLVEAPSPISVEPCASGKAGILSLFVQLPGRPNLAIGSALVSLSDDSTSLGSNQNGNNCDKAGP